MLFSGCDICCLAFLSPHSNFDSLMVDSACQTALSLLSSQIKNQRMLCVPAPLCSPAILCCYGFLLSTSKFVV